jgi:hypothetical protein
LPQGQQRPLQTADVAAIAHDHDQARRESKVTGLAANCQSESSADHGRCRSLFIEKCAERFRESFRGVAGSRNAMTSAARQGCGRSHLMHITARKHNSVTLVCHSRLKAVESQ